MGSIEQRRLWSTSPSAITTYRSCARKWYHDYVLHVERGPTPPYMAKGTSWHYAIEHYLKTGEVLVEHENSDAPGIKWATMEAVQAAIPLLPQPLTNKAYWNDLKQGDPTVGMMIEQSGEIGTWTDPDGTNGPTLRQYLDLVIALKDRCIAQDHKTLSDVRYAKTPEELSTNVQLICNAKFLAVESDYKEFTLRHMYILTKGKRPKAFQIDVTVSREHVEAEWQKILGTVREMAAWAKLGPETADPLPPTVEHCSAYGGCVHKQKCFGNASDLITIRSTSKMNQGEKMGLLDQMMKRAGASAEPVKAIEPPKSQTPTTETPKNSLLSGLRKTPAAPPPAPEPEVLTPTKAQEAAVAAGYPAEFPGYDPNGIVPPDAPSPISTPEEVAAANPPAVETPAEPTKRKRRTKAEMEAARTADVSTKPTEFQPTAVVVEQILPVADVHVAVSPEAVAEQLTKLEDSYAVQDEEVEKIQKILTSPDVTFTCGTEVVFIDCLPGRGWPGEQPIDAIEYVHAFNDLAASSAGKPDYRLIRYESKGYLATAIKVYMKGLPKTLYVDSRMSGADVLLETVIPYAKMVFRGVR